MVYKGLIGKKQCSQCFKTFKISLDCLLCSKLKSVYFFFYFYCTGHLTGKHERHFSISGCPLYHNLSADECKVC